MSTQTSLIVVESDHRVSSETRDEEEEEEEERRGGESIYADRLDAWRPKRTGGLKKDSSEGWNERHGCETGDEKGAKRSETTADQNIKL